MRSTFVASAGAALLATSAMAVNPITMKGQDFLDSSGKRFEIIGIDYQPGGSSGFTGGPGGGDPLSDPSACLRDAALMQQLGTNTIRVYNVDPTLNHDQCVSIFNGVGIYMIIDVNSPLAEGSIVSTDPGPSYNTEYLNRTFQVVDAFKNYPNLLGFFSANELINNNVTAGPNPPYIRAVTRDLHQYIAQNSKRAIPVGYSAAQVQPVLADTFNYVQCAINGQQDDSRSDFFGLNSYSWCGHSSFTQAGYDVLVQMFGEGSIPSFFSEYGCNTPSPRIFEEVPTIYSAQMGVFSGGLVYQWTQDTNNFGLVQTNQDGGCTLLGDYAALQSQYQKINQTYLLSANMTGTNLQPPTCGTNLLTNPSFNNSWTLPPQPSGAAALISSGAGGQVGSIVPITASTVTVPVTGVNSQTISNLAIKTVSSANLPSATGAAAAATSSGAALPMRVEGQSVIGAMAAVAAVWGVL